MKHLRIFEAWDDDPTSDTISPEQLEMEFSKAFSLPNPLDAMIAAKKIYDEFASKFSRAPVASYKNALETLAKKGKEAFNRLTPEEEKKWNEISGRGERIRREEGIRKEREELDLRLGKIKQTMSKMPKRIQDLERHSHLTYKELLNALLSDELTREQVIEILSVKNMS